VDLALKVICPVGDDMGITERRHPCQVGVQDLFARSAQALDDLADAHRIPNQDGIGEQAQATRLVHDLVQIAGTELAAIGEEEAAGHQVVPMIPAVQLQLHAPAHFFIVNVAQNVNGLDHPPKSGQGLGEAVRRRTVGQPLDDDVGWRGPVL